MERYIKIPVKYINQEQESAYRELNLPKPPDPDYVEGFALINERFIAGFTEVFNDDGELLVHKCRIQTVFGASYEVDRSVEECETALGLNIVVL